MNLTKSEIKALLHRCEQHTGTYRSNVLKKAMEKLQAEISSWPVKDETP